MAKRKTSTALRDLNNREHILYRFWDAHEVLLYVGITVDSPTRLSNHMRDKPWWRDVETVKFTTYPNRRAALEAEAEMIRTLKPLYNVHHNEMVEEHLDPGDDESSSLADLPNVVLAELDSDERDYLLREHCEDFNGNERTPGEAELYAAMDAVSGMSHDRLRFQRLVREFLGYAAQTPGGRDYLGEAEQAFRNWQSSGHMSRFDVCRVALEYYVDDQARGYLDSLGSEEGDEWRNRAIAIRGGGCDDLDRMAAKDAQEWRLHGRLDGRGCSRSGTRGALCPRKANSRVWYEICPSCSPRDRACVGHQIWCAPHAKEAAEAGLRVLEDSILGAFPITRWEVIEDLATDPWAVPL